ncbi:hypothetical protein ABIE33_006967 [Ensifer sp. 4252]
MMSLAGTVPPVPGLRERISVSLVFSKRLFRQLGVSNAKVGRLHVDWTRSEISKRRTSWRVNSRFLFVSGTPAVRAFRPFLNPCSTLGQGAAFLAFDTPFFFFSALFQALGRRVTLRRGSLRLGHFVLLDVPSFHDWAEVRASTAKAHALEAPRASSSKNRWRRTMFLETLPRATRRCILHEGGPSLGVCKSTRRLCCPGYRSLDSSEVTPACQDAERTRI